MPRWITTPRWLTKWANTPQVTSTFTVAFAWWAGNAFDYAAGFIYRHNWPMLIVATLVAIGLATCAISLMRRTIALCGGDPDLIN